MSASPIIQCARPVDYKAAVELIEVDTDCNDNDMTINPETLRHKDVDGD